MIARVGLSVALCVCAWPALAQTTFVPKRVTVPRIEGKVRIDGKLDDLGTYNRSLAGSWNVDKKPGTFSITRQ